MSNFSFTPSAWLVAAAAVPAAFATPAYATQYFTVEQAQKVLFAEATEFKPLPVKLSPQQVSTIESMSGVRVRKPDMAVWEVKGKQGDMGWFILDDVIGKHEFITYALALNADGSVRGIEIIDYRETHGGEIRQAAWRNQFTGKKQGAALKLDDDIRNISGATLSCKHMADGVKRLLAAHHVALRRPA